MMQIPVEIADEDVTLLNKVSEDEGVSCEEWVSRLVSASLASHRQEESVPPKQDLKALRAAFGIWADHKEDGLAYQERMRAEWSERSSTPTS